MPTREQFQEYVDIRDSGVTNMWDISYITAVSTKGLTKDICFYIMGHFEEIAEHYGIEI